MQFHGEIVLEKWRLEVFRNPGDVLIGGHVLFDRRECREDSQRLAVQLRSKEGGDRSVIVKIRWVARA